MLRITILIDEIRSFEIDDGETLPIVCLVDAEGIHFTQQDNMGLEDQLSFSWSHVLGFLDILEKIKTKDNNYVRH